MSTDSSPPRATTRDIAERLGLSRTTVCIVLRGEAEKRHISPVTARRVLDAARELNYVPNSWARNLQKQKRTPTKSRKQKQKRTPIYRRG